MYQTLLSLISGRTSKRFRRIAEWIGEDYLKVVTEHQVLYLQVGF